MRWLAIPLLLVAGAVHAADDEGVLRNLVLRHDGRVTTKREWFGWGHRGQDKDIWPASQAFVVEFAADADRDMLKLAEELCR